MSSVSSFMNHAQRQRLHHRPVGASRWMSALEMAHSIGAKKVGRGWMARCPAHDDAKPSLSINEGAGGRILVHCFAGCPQQRVIAALRAMGLWGRGRIDATGAEAPIAPDEHDRDDSKRTEAALSIWHSAHGAEGTLVQDYLKSRSINLPLPDSLRFSPGLAHRSGLILPAMVGLITRGSDGAPLGLHRTYLAHHGAGKAPVEPSKMMLGPCRGGAVRLANPDDLLMVGEGIETCLAAMQASGKPAWAALSTSGMRALELPTNVREIIVLADGDDAGEAAARDCAWRWKREGRGVRIARPPGGQDFNDMLLGRTSCIAGAS